MAHLGARRRLYKRRFAGHSLRRCPKELKQTAPQGAIPLPRLVHMRVVKRGVSINQLIHSQLPSLSPAQPLLWDFQQLSRIHSSDPIHDQLRTSLCGGFRTDDDKKAQ
jgi:hypothetical protein